jgi:hypothetical protein
MAKVCPFIVAGYGNNLGFNFYDLLVGFHLLTHLITS